MEVGIDEEEFIDEDFDQEDLKQNDDEQQQEELENLDEDFVTLLLRSRGIEDKAKIKFDTEDGETEEIDWDNLSNDDKLNIINSSTNSLKNDLDESEIQLLNAIRNSGMTPSEYLQYIEESGIDRYISNNLNNYEYSVDLYTDDELFIADFISRMGDVTDEEAQEALEKAKSNETLFSKLIQAIRNEYKAIEEENMRQDLVEQEQYQLQQFEQFAQSIENQINDFTDIEGYDLNLDLEDMQNLYDFITGVDVAGNNYFAKALADPKILVETAWFALNGRQMINDITEYFQKEITQVRKQSYNKGLEDAKKNSKSNVVFKEKNKEIEEYNDLDDF